MDLRRKNILTATLLLALASVAYAQVYTTTVTYFNIATVESFTVTLPNSVAYTATGGGAATAQIEFNSTDGTDNCVDPCIASTATCQSVGTPIFVVENTGTTTLDISVNMTSPPTCVKLGGSNTSRNAACNSGSLIDTSFVKIMDNLAPSQTANYWEAANFTSCTAGDTSTETQWVYGAQ